MASDELGGRVHDDVGAMFHGTTEVGGGERGVHYQGQIVGVSDIGQSLQVGHRPGGVPDDLRIQKPCPVVDARRKSCLLYTSDAADE